MIQRAQKGVPKPSKEKNNFHYRLECQNGNDIKTNPVQIHVPTTNFGMQLLGQADCVHDFCGHVFTRGSPVRSKGLEGQTLFLFAGAARLSQKEQQISAETIYAFPIARTFNISQTVGHNIEAAFMDSPLRDKIPVGDQCSKKRRAKLKMMAPR